mmetsp:Transcript_48918/g.91683  ORF Transcript_48918/g.91683 Transcript_48918/m.91683 type:complete len:225 (-) Transcript_48918:215-889(-)
MKTGTAAGTQTMFPRGVWGGDDSGVGGHSGPLSSAELSSVSCRSSCSSATSSATAKTGKHGHDFERTKNSSASAVSASCAGITVGSTGTSPTVRFMRSAAGLSLAAGAPNASLDLAAFATRFFFRFLDCLCLVSVSGVGSSSNWANSSSRSRVSSCQPPVSGSACISTTSIRRSIDTECGDLIAVATKSGKVTSVSKDGEPSSRRNLNCAPSPNVGTVAVLIAS